VVSSSRTARNGAALAGLVACALALSGAAGATATVKPDAGSYSGSAGAGFPVSFTVSSNGKEITKLRTDFEGTVNCGPAADDPPYFDFPTLAITDDGFHGATTVTNPSGISPSYTIKGTFSTATHAGGTVHVSFSFPHNALPPCNETDAFSATHRR
jgi:hypothetical protein